MTYKPPIKKVDMALVTEYRNELVLAQTALFALLDHPPEGLNATELQTLRQSRSSRVVTASKNLDAALRGETYRPRGA
jgi:hypothetical protein